MSSIEPSTAQLEMLMNLAAQPESADRPIMMINLLRYRDQAAYAEGFDAEPCTGREAYDRYGEKAVLFVDEAGGSIGWMGASFGSVIAPDDEQWDDAVLVEYPSVHAFLEMVAKPAYQAIVPHRTAALADSRLIGTHTTVPFGVKA